MMQPLSSILTYLLTPWSRVLLEKLNGFQLVKKFPTFYENRKFITAFTSAHHLSLSSVSSIQSIPPTTYFLKITVLCVSSKLVSDSRTFLKGRCTNSGRLSFVQWLLIFLDPGRGDCFVSPSWCLEFWGGFSIFEKRLDPWFLSTDYVWSGN